MIKKNIAGGRQIVVPKSDATIQKNHVHPCEKARKPHRFFLEKVGEVELMSNLQLAFFLIQRFEHIRRENPHKVPRITDGAEEQHRPLSRPGIECGFTAAPIVWYIIVA